MLPEDGPPIAPEPKLPPRPAPVRIPVPTPAEVVPAPIWAGPVADPAPDGTEWPAPPMKVGRLPTGRASRPVRPRKEPRHPLAGLALTVLLALLAAFFAWFSAEPLWLTLGHGVRGTATITTCRVHGIDTHCADFTSDDGGVVATKVTLLGDGHARAGEKVTARMVSAAGWEAYAGDRASLYLRWVPGLGLVVLCGLGIAWATGAYRMPGRRRVLSVLLSIAGPVLLMIGMLAAAW